MENQYKGFAYANENKPTVVYGTTVEDILSKLRSYNEARVDTLKFQSCNIGHLEVESGKYTEYHKYEVSTGKDISNIYLDIPSLSKSNFQKVISELKKEGAQYNPYAKKWYITANQDVQKFQDICNQYSMVQKTEMSEIPETDQEKGLPQIEGVDIQYAVKIENQRTVMIPASELGIDPGGITVGELIDRLGEKAAERIHKDPETTVKDSEYSISVSKNDYDNRCTIYYNDGRDPVNLRGDQYGLHFPTMEADSIADFVADYMRRQESPDLGVTKDYRVGDTVDCYVPAWTDPPHVEDLDKILKPSQPLYVENIAHIIGRVQHVQEFSPNEMFSNAHKKYEILDAAGKTHVVDSSEIYAPSQAQVLLRAAEDELTPQQFDLLADHRMSSAQMEEIRFGFKDGLSAEQVALYAHPDMKPSEMDLCRIALQKGLGYPEINNLLKETKELSWSDSRKRLNEAIHRQSQKEAVDAPQANFYGQEVEVDDHGRKELTQEAVNHVITQGIEKPDFSNCFIVGIEFNQGKYNKVLSEANFENSYLSDCRFRDMDLQKINLKNASIYGTEFNNTILSECDFSNATIAHSFFEKSDIIGNKFNESSLRRSRFNDCILDTNNFSRAILDATEIYPDCNVEPNQKGIDTVQYTMGGAREDEVASYKARTEWKMSGEKAEVRMDIREDIAKSGFCPTKSLISNMEKLDAITGEHHKLKDVVKLYRENHFQNNHELSQTVLDIAEECKQQELSRMAEAIIPE